MVIVDFPAANYVVRVKYFKYLTTECLNEKLPQKMKSSPPAVTQPWYSSCSQATLLFQYETTKQQVEILLIVVQRKNQFDFWMILVALSNRPLFGSIYWGVGTPCFWLYSWRARGPGC